MRKSFYHIKSIVLIAICAALLTGGKMALAALPNIEVVTLFIMLFAYAFGLRIALPATLIFCVFEGVLFGFHYWLIAYFIHWPGIAIVTALISKLKIAKNFVYIIFGVLGTAMFGVTTSAIDALFAMQVAKVNFFVMFSVIYVRGLLFYAAQILSSIFFLTIAFPPLSQLFLRTNKLYFAKG
jgi:energy-coupling factor transport system substrate-specific component